MSAFVPPASGVDAVFVKLKLVFVDEYPFIGRPEGLIHFYQVEQE